MTDAQELKYQEMQKYVPFIQRVIEKLKVNNDDQADNPRKAQLQKMEMLHDLLTNKHKKIKIETLSKCEGVLIKLQAKIEKQPTILQNEDALLSDITLKNQTSSSCTISSSKDEMVQDTDVILGPASPPPEFIPDVINQPVVIPTERRCSPILAKETVKKSSDDNSKQCKQDKQDYQRLQNPKHSINEEFECLRKKVFNVDCKDDSSKRITGKHNSSDDKKSLLCQKTHDSRSSKPEAHAHAKETQHSKHSNLNRLSTVLHKEKNVEANKSPSTSQILQTVKVVITEPLPAHFKQQHFPPKYLPRSSICHNNLRTLPQAIRTKEDNEAYSPDELWEQYNDSHNKRPSGRNPATAPVFSRLGSKVSEDSLPSCPENKRSGRYTPIPDVLKSPPLSVSDINNLLLESGSDKILNDISEIGSRRHSKNEDNQKGSPNNSFEFVRKKLAQTAKLNSLRSESPHHQNDKDDSNISPLSHERIALKYNPHPRHERLQSVSSTDGSECSTQSKINDPRIKLKLQTGNVLRSPTQVAVANVNVLPAINLCDPRLKKQNALSTPPTFTSTPNMVLPNKNSVNYCSPKDPRVTRVPSNTTSPIQATPTRSISAKSQYSSEENWDSDEEEQTRQLIKSDGQLPKKDQHPVERKCDRSGFERHRPGNRNININVRDDVISNRIQLEPSADKMPLIDSQKGVLIGKSCPESNVSTMADMHKLHYFNKSSMQQDTAKTKNKLISSSTFVTPNPPNSDTEEDWDSEPEVSNAKPKPSTTTDVPNLPVNKSPVVTINPPYHIQIPPKPFVNPKHISTASVPSVHTTPILHSQTQYNPVSGLKNLHTHRIQTSSNNNRFNSVLNDKSERIKYFEAKKQKTIEPRTYKEFREAKERSLAQEAANKRATDEAEAKKRVNEFKDIQKNKEITENANGRKEKHVDISAIKKVEDSKKEKKLYYNKDNNKTIPAGESTLDKMYRTQNFNSNFPRANSNFKIPKKKTEEKSKGETTSTNEFISEQTRNISNNTLEEKTKSNQIQTLTEKIKSTEQEINDIKSEKSENFNVKHTQANICITSEEKHTPEQYSKNSLANKSSTHKQNLVVDKTKDNSYSQIISENNSFNQKNENNDELFSKEKSTEHILENNLSKSAADDNKINVRDPRCRPKASAQEIEQEEKNEEINMLGNIMITSIENDVIKPQQNLEKFNKLANELAPKPQRILRRRNTMVVFDSAPLVDKEKLKKANALLFEDVQEEEKRKRKQAEEDRLIARRNKNLEEMFKKTDDNCTVSTQNIITGKRRTRASINFNETINAKNVFKQKSTTSPSTQSAKATKTNFKIKIKNLSISSGAKDDESDEDDESLEIIAKREAKIKKDNLKDKDMKLKTVKTKSSEVTKTKDESKTEESESDSEIIAKTNNKLTKKGLQSSKTITSNNHNKFKPIQNDEHQNCAVSSTSTDNCTGEEVTSTNNCFKKETDDNEPTSTASKSSNPTPTPDCHEPVLKEITDQILKPGANREHILGVLGQILSEEKLELIKSLIESCNKQNDEDEEDVTKEQKNNQSTAEENSEAKLNQFSKMKDSDIKENEHEEEEQEQKERKVVKSAKATGGKKLTMPKKKRSELDRLNEDIRDMFICNGVLTATGRRMCTIMSKDVASDSSKKSARELTRNLSVQGNINQNKEGLLKPPVATRTLRRSTRCSKVIEDNEDNESVLSRTTEESIDDSNATSDTSSATDIATQRKMPILKPHTPIKIPEEEVLPKVLKTKELNVIKRKSDSKIIVKAKKPKTTSNNNYKSDSQSEEKESETEVDEVEEVETENDKKCNKIKNTNIHWHNQSKYTTWCMICEKKLTAISSSLHYKTHHRENYISRMAPVLLQQFKQGKLNRPMFGVKKRQKQPSWFYRCPFCLKYFNTSMPLWLEHFQNHTVEFRYECSKCHRSSNRKLTITRHIKTCDGATVISSAVKLNIPTVINAHVCHLCNFIQLKRDNLERHYIEQHQLDTKTIDLLGYTIKLFDVENVEWVNEEHAIERENEAWKSIEKDEQVIDIDDDEILCPIPNNNYSPQLEDTAEHKEKSKVEKSSQDNENEKEIQEPKKFETLYLSCPRTQESKTQAKVTRSTSIQSDRKKLAGIDNQADREDSVEKTTLQSNKDTKFQSVKGSQQEEIKEASYTQETSIQSQNCANEKKRKKLKTIFTFDLSQIQGSEFEVIDEKETVQDVQDELLALAAIAAENEDESHKSSEIDNNNVKPPCSISADGKSENETAKNVSLSVQEVSKKSQTTMSDIISSSIDMIYNRTDKQNSIDLGSVEARKVCQTASNIFMPTRDENNYSPTIQILAQSIINIEDPGNSYMKDKPITMAERLSQRFKSLQNDETTPKKSNTICSTTTAISKSSKENDFEKLIDDTLLELVKEKDSASDKPGNLISAETPVPQQSKENAFAKLFNETALELENDNDNTNTCEMMQQNDLTQRDSVTVISDDEDWEDIEITETAPTTSINAGHIQKTKSKGLYQKFGLFKGNSTKSKKHLTPMVFLPKKKTKDKPSNATTLPVTTNVAITKSNEITSSNSLTKPVINIMDGLFPDSPCNDPIDLVPELAPLEPLQDLNDISSILDSNLSAVNINAADNHTSIEDALDFISEQQANDKQKSNCSSFSTISSQAKTTINNILHVGFSVQNAEKNSFKFYCLLQNCSFLYSSDSVGLENHFMCEHSQIKWTGYCLMCQAHCFPNNTDVHSISKEIQHMMEKHANNAALYFNADSTQNSNTSSHDNEERPKIKLRRLTGDCLSRATPENVPSINDSIPSSSTTSTTTISMLGALLVADPKPPTKEMPPQPQMPLTEPLLLDNNRKSSAQLSFRNVNSDFVITSVTSAASKSKETPLQISNVISLNDNTIPPTTESEQRQIPKITNVRTLAPTVGSLWAQQIEKDRSELAEAAEESVEVSRILENAARPLANRNNRDVPRTVNDSPVLVAETVPLAQSKTGDFVVTQTVSAQYNDFTSTAVDFNISIAASTIVEKTNLEPVAPNSTSISSRQYKCMGAGCKFVSRVPVAMSDHLRFHERRNFSNKRDYLACGFCFYCASDVEDYMQHANQFHIVNKGAAVSHVGTASETDTATSLTKKIQSILNSGNGSSGPNRFASQSQTSLNQNQTLHAQDTQEVYLKKLRETVDEIVGPTGLADDKLYRCVLKNCHSPLTESTFLNHIIYHITTNGGNPNSFIYKCPHCKAQYYRPAGIKAHIKSHSQDRYFCYLCDETSTNPGQLLKHFSEKHWHTLSMYTKELLPSKVSADGSDSVIDSRYYVAYTQDLTDEELRKFGEKLILEWQRKKSGSKTHFKSTEIDLLPLSAIFQRQVNCGECEYKTKVRTNMFRHLLMHKQNPGLANKSGVSKVCSVDPVNPVPCLNSSERFFDKMTNLASSSLIPSSSASPTTKTPFKLPQGFVDASKHYSCGCDGCNYHTISEDLFRTHLSEFHSKAMSYSCLFCKEEICKRGISIDRIVNHTRFHGTTIYRCEECNYNHYLRYVVERHINEKHATMKVNIITHNRSNEDSVEGTTTSTPFAGKKYKETTEVDQTAQTSSPFIRSINNDSSVQKPISTYVNSAKSKGKYLCDVCGHGTATVGQMQTHCHQQHAVKNQYKCAHCNFGSQQISQILHHIDEKHPGKTREARCMYHKAANSGDEVADTRPLWQRNDPTRVRHIRGILMEDEEESEEYQKKLVLTEDDDSNEDQNIDVEENDDELKGRSYVSGYEFGCYHCSFKTQTFETLKNQHYSQTHNCDMETAKPFWYRLHRRLCCPECRSFVGNYNELQQHLQNTHKKSRFYAVDIRMAENDDTSQRILCGYCSFHCANLELLYKHHLRAQHWPQDIRIDNNEQIMEILTLGKAEVSYQCTLCADIFCNRVSIVQHACNCHAGEDSFSVRELTNSLIYRCNSCCFTSTTEMELLRHTIDHYSRFKVCSFCQKPQSSFNVYMHHCYAEHKNDIHKFKANYPLTEIRKFLLQTLVVFPSGLVLKKRNLLNTKYGKTDVIEELYEEIYKISQQPPIPRLSIARLVARKSIEAQHKHLDYSSTLLQDEILDKMHARPKSISKRRCTVAFSREDDHANGHPLLKPKITIVEGKTPENIGKRRTTLDINDQQEKKQQKHKEFSEPQQLNKISKRRRTVAVDRETLFSSNLMSSTNSLLAEIDTCGKKRKSSCSQLHAPSHKHLKEMHPLNLDMDPFSFYGNTPEILDLSKIYTKVAIGGIKTPLTIDKFKLLFNIDCQLKLTKCDDNQLLVYNDYKHIKKACPASQKIRYD